MTHRRTNFNLKTVEDLDALLSVAIPHVSKLQRDRANDLDAALDWDDKDLWKLIDKHRFDLNGFFARAVTSDKFWDDGAFSQNLWDVKA